MKLLKLISDRKNGLLLLTLFVGIGFLYGCQCEGSIGNSSDNSNTVEISNTNSKIK